MCPEPNKPGEFRTFAVRRTQACEMQIFVTRTKRQHVENCEIITTAQIPPPNLGLVTRSTQTHRGKQLHQEIPISHHKKSTTSMKKNSSIVQTTINISHFPQ